MVVRGGSGCGADKALKRGARRVARCADMREGCPSMRPDRLAPDYDLVADAFRE